MHGTNALRERQECHFEVQAPPVASVVVEDRSVSTVFSEGCCLSESFRGNHGNSSGSSNDGSDEHASKRRRLTSTTAAAEAVEQETKISMSFLRDVTPDMETQMTHYIRRHYYRTLKFPTSDAASSRIVKKCVRANMVTRPKMRPPDNMFIKTFSGFFTDLVPKSLSQLRRNSRALARRHWKVDIEKGLVPASFPGTVGLVCGDNGNGGDDGDNGSVTVNAEYRRYGTEDNEDFYYFVTRILTAINPTNNYFEQRNHNELLSDIFSVTDEAFALLVIYNEHDVWNYRRERKLGNTVERKTTRFCNDELLLVGSQKRRQRQRGWMKEGRELFHDLCLEVDRLRKQPETGTDLEKRTRDRFRKEQGLVDIDIDDDIVDNYIDPVLLALLNGIE